MRVPIALLALSPFFAALSPLSAQRLKVGAEQKIGDGAGGLTGFLETGAGFGSGVAHLSDLDGDGIAEVAVGVPNEVESAGAVWILKLDAAVTVELQEKIPGLGQLLVGTKFGTSLAAVGDLDGDGISELAVGRPVLQVLPDRDPPGVVT